VLFRSVRENGDWFIEDLESRNGTFVNKYNSDSRRDAGSEESRRGIGLLE
jgi:pSer/pThr/pTyr-binding forkhead associated (FHA) protein